MRQYRQTVVKGLAGRTREVCMVFRGLKKHLSFVPKMKFVLIFSIFVFFGFCSVSKAEPIGSPAIKGAEYVGTETCATCHDRQFNEYKLSTHARLDIKDPAGTATGCAL